MAQTQDLTPQVLLFLMRIKESGLNFEFELISKSVLETLTDSGGLQKHFPAEIPHKYD